MASAAARTERKNSTPSLPTSSSSTTTTPTTKKQDDLLRGVYGHGFEKPSAIQARALPAILGVDFVSSGTSSATAASARNTPSLTTSSSSSSARRDVIAQAQSGTGKTSMIALASCALADPRKPECQVLILSPTRELAGQIHGVAAELLSAHDGVPAATQTHGLVMGGANRRAEAERLVKGVNLLVATPGRLLDHLNNTPGFVTRNLAMLVVDEADRILEVGFE